MSGTYLARGAGDLAKTIYNLREHLWSRLGSNQSPRRANALNGPRRPSRVTGRLRRSPLSLVGAAVGDRVERVHVGFVRLACALTDQFTWSSCCPIRLSKTTSDLHRNWCAILGLNLIPQLLSTPVTSCGNTLSRALTWVNAPGRTMQSPAENVLWSGPVQVPTQEAQ